MAMIHKGDKVRVHPHGDETRVGIGTVLIVSENQLSIAVAFGDPTPAIDSMKGVAIDPEHGIILLAKREELNGVPWGPWVCIFTGNHYEIEGHNG